MPCLWKCFGLRPQVRFEAVRRIVSLADLHVLNTYTYSLLVKLMEHRIKQLYGEAQDEVKDLCGDGRGC